MRWHKSNNHNTEKRCLNGTSFFLLIFATYKTRRIMKNIVGFNGTLLQVFTIGDETSKGTFTDEPAANKVLHANADLTLTATFVDGSTLEVDLVSGQDVGFNATVATITTTAEALLS